MAILKGNTQNPKSKIRKALKSSAVEGLNALSILLERETIQNLGLFILNYRTANRSYEGKALFTTRPSDEEMFAAEKAGIFDMLNYRYGLTSAIPEVDERVVDKLAAQGNHNNKRNGHNYRSRNNREHSREYKKPQIGRESRLNEILFLKEDEDTSLGDHFLLQYTKDI